MRAVSMTMGKRSKKIRRRGKQKLIVRGGAEVSFRISHLRELFREESRMKVEGNKSNGAIKTTLELELSAIGGERSIQGCLRLGEYGKKRGCWERGGRKLVGVSEVFGEVKKGEKKATPEGFVWNGGLYDEGVPVCLRRWGGRVSCRSSGPRGRGAGWQRARRGGKKGGLLRGQKKRSERVKKALVRMHVFESKRVRAVANPGQQRRLEGTWGEGLK